MYDELIKRLRECTAEQNGEKTLWHQAANAIEDLDNRLNLHRQGKIGHWIPVTERLPEEDGSYLIVNGKTVTKIVSEAYYNKRWGDSCWTDPVEMYMTYHPTHWMPLPQPPESEGE